MEGGQQGQDAGVREEEQGHVSTRGARLAARPLRCRLSPPPRGAEHRASLRRIRKKRKEKGQQSLI